MPESVTRPVIVNVGNGVGAGGMVGDISPTAELDKALQAPTNESIQQAADEAVFQRRALAVEKERAISENELQNRIELARREADLITQQGGNDCQRAEEESAAATITANELPASYSVDAKRMRVDSSCDTARACSPNFRLSFSSPK